jgi:hypothetical protein
MEAGVSHVLRVVFGILENQPLRVSTPDCSAGLTRAGTGSKARRAWRRPWRRREQAPSTTSIGVANIIYWRRPPHDRDRHDAQLMAASNNVCGTSFWRVGYYPKYPSRVPDDRAQEGPRQIDARALQAPVGRLGARDADLSGKGGHLRPPP